MSNEDFDFTAPPIDFGSRRAQALVALGTEDNPDEAARANQLARASGTNPGSVYENRENFETQYKTRLAGDIVRNNEFIQDYVNSHPLAAKVSNDDYGQLDTASKAISKFRGDASQQAQSVLGAALRGFKETSSLDTLGEDYQKLSNYLAANPVFAKSFISAAAFGGTKLGLAEVGAGLESTMRVVTGVIGGAAAAIGEIYHQAGGTEADQAKLTRDLIVMAQVGMSGQAGLHGPIHPEVHAAMQEAGKVARALGPYVEAGKEPPVGLHPIIDEAKIDQAKIDAENLAEALKESAKSATRERDPEMFAAFARQHTDMEIISPAKKGEFDQVPWTADDGNPWGMSDEDYAVWKLQPENREDVARWNRDNKIIEYELFKHVQGEIGISVDAVRKLYGDKLPEPDDGILGFVPNLAEQLARAEATGGDIQVPLADYLAKVEPEVHRELKDFIRARPEGMTVEEGKAAPKYEEDSELFDPVDSLRSAAGLQGPKERPVEAKPPTDLEPAERAAFEKASAIGRTVEQYKLYQKLIAERAALDAERASTRAMADQRRRQTAEWKSNRAELRPQVKDTIESRPDVALDEMLRGGKVKLSPEGLTTDQLAVLPKDFIAKDGVHIEDIAGLVGDSQPTVLVDKVIALNQERDAAGMRPAAHLQRLVDIETDRQMEAKYGSLDRNILDEAKDQVLSETQEEMLHEQTLALATQAGLEFSITKEGIKAAARDFFDRALTREVSSDKFLAESGRAWRALETAALKDDFAEAFRQSQRQYLAVVMARLAKQFEKRQGQFERLAKRFSAREVAGVEQEYTNWVHDILGRTGNVVKRSVADLAESLERSEHKTLSDFVDYKVHHDLREVSVAEFLHNPAFKSRVEDMTTADFNALHDSVKSLAKNGRDEQKAVSAGDEADLAAIKGKMLDTVRRFKEKEYDAEGKRTDGGGIAGKILRGIFVAHLQVETLFDRLDRFDPKGVWNQYVFRDLVEGVNGAAKLEREFAKKLGAIADNVNLREVIPNNVFVSPFKKDYPIEIQPPMQMTRKNLRVVLLNAGNRSNLFKMAKGYGLEPEQVMDWLHANAKKEDWDWAQKIWDMLEEIHQLSNKMYRGLSGIEPEGIPIEGVSTPHGDYRGGYYPLIRHPTFGEDVRLYKTGLEGEGYVRATTGAGYTKERTGAIYPLALDLDMLPNRIKQMIHDISLRPAVINAGKIFYDKHMHAEMVKHLGKEYADMFIPWLRDVANVQNFMSGSAREFAWWSDFMRQNAITTLIGWNPSTVMKHTPTAIASSMAQVGPINFLNAMRGSFGINEATSERNWQFAIRNSEELQRRSRNWLETAGGGQAVLEGRTIGKALVQGDKTAAFMSLRELVSEIATKPVAMGDLLSAIPTWSAEYWKGMNEHGIHGDAVYIADKAVRQAHGSSAITSRSSVARSQSALAHWMTGFFTYFNDLGNRQAATVWQAGEALQLAKEGEKAEAMAQVPKLVGRLFAYVIVPAMFEELVSPMTNDKHESWGKMAAKALIFTLSSSWVGVRDVVSGALNGRDPSAGLLSTFLKSGADAYRDVVAPKLKPENIIKHATQFVGMLSGIIPAQIGRTSEFMYKVDKGTERPKGPWGWAVGLRYGTLKNHSQTFDQWMKGK